MYTFRSCPQILTRLFATIAVAFIPAVHAEDPKPAPQPAMEEISPGVYRIKQIVLDKNTHTVRFPGKLNMDEGILEYLLVTKEGAAHESLLTSEIQPNDLHFAMLLLGAKGAGIAAPDGKEAALPTQIDAAYLKTAPQLKGDVINISVKWTQDGKQASVPVEDWILNEGTHKSVERGPWTYNGSVFSDNAFLAQIQGCFAALVLNPAALINNPRKGNDDDTLWVPNKTKLPPLDTQIEITIKLESSTSK